MAYRLGRNMKLYRLTSGTRAAWPGTGAPSNLDLVTKAADVTLEIDKELVDVTTREGNGWSQNLVGTKDLTLNVTIPYDPADTDYEAFVAAAIDDSVIALAVMDDLIATVGAKGYWFDAIITNQSEPQPVKGVVVCTFTFRVALTSVPPARVTVGA